MKVPTQHRAIITISRPAPCVIIEIIAHNELPSSISISTFCRLYFLYQLLSVCILTMAIRVVEVSSGGTKFERFLPKNHQTQRKLLNFENWTYGKPQYLAKIRVFKVDYFIPPLISVPKLRSVAQNEWKNPHIYFFYFWFKNKRV